MKSKATPIEDRSSLVFLHQMQVLRANSLMLPLSFPDTCSKFMIITECEIIGCMAINSCSLVENYCVVKSKTSREHAIRSARGCTNPIKENI